MITCYYVNYSRQNERKDLRYGDFIQMQSVGLGLSKFKKGYLVSETNFSGFGPSVKYRIATNSKYKELISFDSIFQIVPKDISQYGLPLGFKGQNTCKICLKHFLSGRLLSFKEVETDLGTTTTLGLSEDFTDFAAKWMSDPSNKSIIKTKRKQEQKRNDQTAGSKKRSYQVLPELTYGESLKEFIAKKYFSFYTIIIVREASADEDNNLLTSNLLEINDLNGGTLSIMNKENDKYLGIGDNKTCTYFESSYYKTCQNDIQISNMKFLPKKQSESFLDTFLMQHVGIPTINKIIHYVSIITPLITVIQSKAFTLDLIAEGENAIKKIKRAA